MKKRKPHDDYAGYVSERKVHAYPGGYVIILDRKNGGDWVDAGNRWVVVVEPSGTFMSVTSPNRRQ